MPKTLAIRLDDQLHAAASAVAQLQGTSLTELIRTAIEEHLEAQKANGALAERAQALLSEIDEEAENRRKAIQGLLGSSPAKTSTRGRKAAPEAS